MLVTEQPRSKFVIHFTDAAGAYFLDQAAKKHEPICAVIFPLGYRMLQSLG